MQVIDAFMALFREHQEFELNKHLPCVFIRLWLLVSFLLEFFYFEIIMYVIIDFLFLIFPTATCTIEALKIFG